MKIAIKVVPGSSRDAVVGWLGDALKVKVRAKAEQGKANKAVEKILAEVLGLAQKNVQIAAGKTASRKTVHLSGITATELQEKIRQAIE